MSFVSVIDRFPDCSTGSKPAHSLWAPVACVWMAGALVGSAWADPLFSAARSTDVADPPYSVAVGDKAGWGSVVWDGRDNVGREVGSGTYFLRLESGGEVQVRKVVLAR